MRAFVLCDARRPVAYGEVWIDEKEQEVELARILVDPGFRRRGHGARLLDHEEHEGIFERLCKTIVEARRANRSP